MNALRLFFSAAALALLLGGLPLATLAQTTRFVSTTGTNADPTSATSWATSTTDLQGAINASTAGDQVWVAAGVYKPTSGTARTASFAMKNNVAIYGGFVGSETALSGRPAINPVSVSGNPSSSTLSGDLLGDDGPNFANNGDNSYHVISNPRGLTTTAVLDGFVITAGNANSSNPNDRGGGVFNNGGGSGGVCSPSFRNCTLLNNRASNGGSMFNNGGSLGQSSPVLTNCAFVSNSAGWGGTMYNFGQEGQSSPLLTNCAFQNNYATTYGGVMVNNGYNNGQSSPQLINCTLQNNSASSGWAIFNSYGNPSLINCVLWGNGGNKTFYNDNGSVSATYSLFDNTVTGYTSGPGNLTVTVSPFASTTPGMPASPQLAPCSPAIDAGNPATTSATVGTTDLAGNSRFFNNGRVDMGAVEFQGAGLPTSFSVLGSGTATCASSPTISLSGSETGVSYQLQRDGISVGSSLTGTGSALSFGPQSLSGLYTVLATNTAFSCTLVMAQSATVVGNTNAPTGANLTASNSGTLTCSIQTLTLTASATPGTPGSLSYVFAGPSGTLAGSGNTRPVSATGLYSVTITGANGCTTSASTTVFSNSAAPTAGLVASGTITCAVPAVTLTASGAGTYSFAGPSIVSVSGNSATVNVGSTYSVTVLNPANGCFNSTTVSVSSDLGGAPAAPILSASSSVVCEGTNVLVVASVSGAPSGLQWYLNGSPVSGQTSATLSLGGVQAAQAGSYVLVVAGVCSVTSAPFNLTVNPLPTVTLTVPQGATVVGPETGTATITLPALLTGVAMQVFGGTGYERLIILDRINGFEIRQVDSNTTGIFNVTRTGPFRLTVTDGNGCKRTVEGVVRLP